MVLESGIERRPNPWSVKIAQRRHREARYAYASGRSSAVFLLGYLGHWNRDRDCEPAQLTSCLHGVPASCFLLPASCFLLAASCLLLAASCLLLAACCLLLAACCLLLAACCFLLA